VLAPLVLGLLFVYSLTKRFTAYSHLVLGVCLALAPAGVWYALTARFDWEPLPLLAGVLFWVAGFDLLYACQDIDIDRRAGLCSIPAKYGVAASLRLSLVFHVLALLAFILFGQSAGLGVLFYAGLMFFAALLFSQHRLISARNLSRVNAAFFSRNGAASIVFFIAVLLDRILV
jgi:4-hydroxybenzoate polyprenyltransferase